MTARLIITGFSGALEREFYTENLRLSLNLIRFTTLLGCLLMAGFGVVNHFIAPHPSNNPWLTAFPVIRIIIITPAALLCFFATFTKSFPRFAYPLFCAYGLLFALGISGRMAFSTNDDPAYLIYYVGLIMVCIGVDVGVHLRFVYAAGTGALLIAMYFIAALLFNRLPDTTQGRAFFISNSFFLLAAETMGLVACFFSEYYRRNVFLLRKRIRVEEEAARRKAFAKWKEAYRTFRELNRRPRAGFRRPAPAASHAEREKNERLSDLIDTLGVRRGSGRAFDRILDFVLEISGARRGAIILQNGQFEEPMYIARRGIERRDLSFISGIVAEALSSGKPVAVNLTLGRGDFVHREAAHTGGIGSLICFPVDLEDVAIGACYLDQSPSDDPFSGESDELVIALVTQVILSVDGSGRPADGEPAEIDEPGFAVQCKRLGLTPRERELARLVLQGFSRKKICSKLLISVNTLRTHLKNINGKAGVSKRAELLRLLAGEVPGG